MSSSATTLPPGMHAGKSGRQLGWPRCRFCHQEIRNLSTTDPGIWEHVATLKAGCDGRPNVAEPVPQIHEEPFMEATWEFVTRYRKLRRAFRELSQARASAVRRMNDYQALVDDLVAAYDEDSEKHAWSPQMAASVEALKQYRSEKRAAGWR